MANNTDFQPGDVVQLKSGGAPQTVARIDGTNVHVYYADEHGNPVNRSLSIPAIVLKKVDPPTESYNGPLPFSGGA